MRHRDRAHRLGLQDQGGIPDPEPVPDRNIQRSRRPGGDTAVAGRKVADRRSQDHQDHRSTGPVGYKVEGDPAGRRAVDHRPVDHRLAGRRVADRTPAVPSAIEASAMSASSV